jgi:hypothetical protein
VKRRGNGILIKLRSMVDVVRSAIWYPRTQDRSTGPRVDLDTSAKLADALTHARKPETSRMRRPPEEFAQSVVPGRRNSSRG